MDFLEEYVRTYYHFFPKALSINHGHDIADRYISLVQHLFEFRFRKRISLPCPRTVDIKAKKTHHVVSRFIFALAKNFALSLKRSKISKW